MSSFTTSTNMLLPISIIGQTQDPEWESNLNTSQTLIDSHNHDGAGHGVQLLPAAISFAAGGFNFAATGQTNAAYYQMVFQTASPGGTSGFGLIYVKNDGSLHYQSPTTDIPITTSTGLINNGAANGFQGSDYQVTGGTALYNTASGSFPYQGTFYFYTSTTVPSNDTGTRAGLAAAFLDLKNATSGSVGPGTYYNATNTGVSEKQYFGVTSYTSPSTTTGLMIGKLSGGAQQWSPSFTVRENSTSQTMSNANPTNVDARSYEFSVNGAFDNGTVTDGYGIAVRRVGYGGAGSTASTNVAYLLASLADSTGVPQTPGNNFGASLDYRVQFGNTFGQQAIAARTLGSYWTSTAGAFTITPYGGGSPNTVAFEAGVAADNGTSIGIGVAANRTTTGINLGSNTSVTGNLSVSGTTAQTGAVTGTTATYTGNVQASTFRVQTNASTPVGGFFGKNQRIVAWGTSNQPSSFLAGYNIASCNFGSLGICNVTYTNAVSPNNAVIITLNDSAAVSIIYHLSSSVTTGFTAVFTTPSNAAPPANYNFSFVVIGDA